jgi:hypothetical protein
MNDQQKLLPPFTVKELTDRLGKIASVAQFDAPDEPQGSTIANALSDLEDSFSIVLNNLLPKLLDQTKSPEELDDVLLDIGEELRHILYHIRDTKYFGYLVSDEEKQRASSASSPKSTLTPNE